jgi:hypothetical protein
MDDNPDGTWLQEPVDVTRQEQRGQSPDQQSKGTDYQGIESFRSKGLGSTGGAPENGSAKDQPMAADGYQWSTLLKNF